MTAWERIGKRQHKGIDLPLFALRSKNSCGVGEFFDLIPLIDWCSELKIDFIQLLPLNDSGIDPSPYNILSSCALHPRYISLWKLDKNYPKDLNEKLPWLYKYYEKWEKNDPNFLKFVSENTWLEAYGQYKSNPPFQNFLQYLCYTQLVEVKKYANSKGVFIQGDLPILIARESVDVTTHTSLFIPNYSAGAPPDQYNKNGQYWGFPIFDWENHKKDGFAWWKQRIHYAENFYDIYRIDHVVGFFRIWAIPLGEKTKNGKFIPENPAEWIPHGQEILKMMLNASNMLPIAEDLGTVPLEVHACLTELGICGTKVMRWERRWQTDKEYIPLNEYPLLSLTCVSTHDSETLTLWWKNNREEAELYAKSKGWKYVPDLPLEMRKAILTDSNHTSSLFHCNLLQEYLALIPELAWGDPEQERINIPGKVLPTNWNYRFRPTVEEIVSHEGLKNVMRQIL